MKYDTIKWDKHKTNGYINLFSAYKDYYGDDEIIPFDILNDIMKIHPIGSRQVAAVALAVARDTV
jgi:hypothetical protein